MPEEKREDEAYIRAGDTAVLLSWEGAGRQRKLVGRIVREIPKEVLKVDPEATEKWTLEELIALKTVIEKAENHAISVQSQNLRVLRETATREAARAAAKAAAEADKKDPSDNEEEEKK